MEKETVISRNILENMSDGVMTIDLQGQIITFNPAAAKMLGLDKDDVVGKKFAEVFFEHEGNDDFNQAILDAIYESSISHNRTVDFKTGLKTISLSLTTSFLRSMEGGAVNKVGVIAVFSDITEVKKLRDAEMRLTEELKGKHRELQDTYLKIEESNRSLETALKKVQVVRIAATGFIIVLFLGIGLLVWNKKHSVGRSAQASTTKKETSRTIKVMPRQVSSSIALTGTLEPLHVYNITSPFSGNVREVYFRYGDIVKSGQAVLKMDTSDVAMKHKEAKAAYIKALNNFKDLQNWENGREAAGSRRSLTKSKLTLESQKKTFEETERLFKKGIVSSSEYESARQQYSSAQLDYQSAQDELKATLIKGSEENMDIARLEMENAQTKLTDLEFQLKQSVVTSPVSGVIVLHTAGTDEKNIKRVEKGGSFQQGEILFSIGDLTGLSVKSNVDEVDVTKIKTGQTVRVTGDAFAGISLTGKIYSVSSQASKASGSGGGSGVPAFEITVSIGELTPEQKKRVLVGMSANIEIIIYENPNALLVPISAVITEGGKRYVNMKAPGSEPGTKTEIKTGYTDIDTVEVVSGLKAGDEIVVR